MPRRRKTRLAARVPASPAELGPKLEERFGLSWQIVPRVLEGMLGDEDTERVSRVLAALFQMTKLDLRALQAAYDKD